MLPNLQRRYVVGARKTLVSINQEPIGIANTFDARIFGAADSISQRLARLQGMGNTLLRLRIPEQAHELAALQLEKPVLVDQTPRLQLAATEHARDRQSDLEVVSGDKSAVAHVDQHHLQRCDAGL